MGKGKLISRAKNMCFAVNEMALWWIGNLIVKSYYFSFIYCHLKFESPSFPVYLVCVFLVKRVGLSFNMVSCYSSISDSEYIRRCIQYTGTLSIRQIEILDGRHKYLIFWSMEIIVQIQFFLWATLLCACFVHLINSYKKKLHFISVTENGIIPFSVSTSVKPMDEV